MINPKIAQVSNYILPPVSQRMRTGYALLDYSLQSEYEYDGSAANNDGNELIPQSVTIDNSANDASLVFTSDKYLGFTRTILAGQVLVFNIPAIDPPYFKCVSAGAGVVKLYIHNYPSMPDIQQVDSSTFAVLPPAFTDATVTVTTASGQKLAENVARRYLLVQNNSDTGIIYIAHGVAATTTHLRVMPGGSYEPAVVPSSALFMIGDIASNPNVVIIEG